MTLPLRVTTRWRTSQHIEGHSAKAASWRQDAARYLATHTAHTHRTARTRRRHANTRPGGLRMTDSATAGSQQGGVLVSTSKTKAHLRRGGSTQLAGSRRKRAPPPHTHTPRTWRHHTHTRSAARHIALRPVLAERSACGRRGRAHSAQNASRATVPASRAGYDAPPCPQLRPRTSSTS